ncbi:MAG TPA: PQQ-dependent sugar dehydrogenase [Gemmatimonadales bacterium]|nr:PQQ-dependent sugar dehydrogenase [Gemmatimonadales bacterium]
MADVTRRFGEGGTGIALADGWLYYATDDGVYRYRWGPGQLQPSGSRETIVQGLPTGGHEAKSIALGAGDALYVNIGSETNSCQEKDRGNRSPGHDPCHELDGRAGVWRFSASRTGQRQSDGRRVATGLRNALGLAVHPGSGELWSAVHGRDQLAQNWGFDERKSAENPGEELVGIAEGDDFGWPYCYYDVDLETKVLAPEYGGDGKSVGRCAKAKAPVAVYPGQWAPMAVAFGRAARGTGRRCRRSPLAPPGRRRSGPPGSRSVRTVRSTLPPMPAARSGAWCETGADDRRPAQRDWSTRSTSRRVGSISTGRLAPGGGGSCSR